MWEVQVGKAGESNEGNMETTVIEQQQKKRERRTAISLKRSTNCLANYTELILYHNNKINPYKQDNLS